MLKALASVAVLFLPVSLAWAAVNVSANSEGPDSARCEIRVSYHDGNVVLEGLVFSPAPISGAYHMRISGQGGGGSADLAQSGGFRVESGALASLGLVSLSPGRYVATLKLEWDSGAAECSERVPGNTMPLKRAL